MTKALAHEYDKRLVMFDELIINIVDNRKKVEAVTEKLKNGNGNGNNGNGKDKHNESK